MKEKVGLAKVARREERERKQKQKRELDELVRLAKDILVEDHRKQTEQAKLTKLAEKELKMVITRTRTFDSVRRLGDS